MVDLERLRIWDDPGETLCREAADEIERLRAKLNKLHSYNIDIQAGRLNYRPQDHIQVIEGDVIHSHKDGFQPSRLDDLTRFGPNEK